MAPVRLPRVQLPRVQRDLTGHIQEPWERGHWGVCGVRVQRGHKGGGSSEWELLWQRPVGHPGLWGRETQRATQSCGF